MVVVYSSTSEMFPAARTFPTFSLNNCSKAQWSSTFMCRGGVRAGTFSWLLSCPPLQFWAPELTPPPLSRCITVSLNLFLKKVWKRGTVLFRYCAIKHSHLGRKKSANRKKEGGKPSCVWRYGEVGHKHSYEIQYFVFLSDSSGTQNSVFYGRSQAKDSHWNHWDQSAQWMKLLSAVDCNRSQN